MTDFQMSPSTAVTFENLEWDLTPVGQRRVFGGTLAVAAFTAAQHFPDGFLKSGLVLALSTGTHAVGAGFLVPYLNAATAGTGAEVAVGFLVHSVPVTRQLGGTNRARLGVAYATNLVVATSKLPYTVANAPAGGYLDTPGRADLPQCTWSA